MELCLIREGLARGCTEAETAFALQGLGSFPLLQSGTESMIEEWVPRLARGEAVAGFALTEPDAGTDVAALSLKAERDGDGYVLNGEKIWISNAPGSRPLHGLRPHHRGGRRPRDHRLRGAARERGVSPARRSRCCPRTRSAASSSRTSTCPVRRCSARSTAACRWRCAPSTSSGPASAPSRSAWPRRRSPRPSPMPPTRDAFGGKLKDLQAVSHRLADVAARVQARAPAGPRRRSLPSTVACGRSPRPRRWPS